MSTVFFCGCKRAVFLTEENKISPFFEKTIVIDAGHGGFDGGAVGKSGTYEKDINLAIALQLKELLQKEGANVVMTREDDSPVAHTKYEDMEKRAQIIKDSACVAMISIHQNIYEDSDVNGPQVFYYKDGTKAMSLAKSVQEELNALKAVNKKREAKTGDYKVLRAGNSPNIIAECGFISNYDDEKRLKDPAHQKEIAQAIKNGLAKYIEKHDETEV